MPLMFSKVIHNSVTDTDNLQFFFVQSCPPPNPVPVVYRSIHFDYRVSGGALQAMGPISAPAGLGVKFLF